MTDSFSALHPALTFCYFAAVLLLTMFVLHPVFLALSRWARWATARSCAAGAACGGHSAGSCRFWC